MGKGLSVIPKATNKVACSAIEPVGDELMNILHHVDPMGPAASHIYRALLILDGALNIGYGLTDE